LVRSRSSSQTLVRLTEQTNYGRSGPFAPTPLQGLHHYYEPVRQPHSATVLNSSRCFRLEVSLSPPQKGDSVGAGHPTFHAKAADQTLVASAPDTTWPINGTPARLLPGSKSNARF
jgi:hypothetical protein